MDVEAERDVSKVSTFKENILINVKFCPIYKSFHECVQIIFFWASIAIVIICKYAIL